MKFPSWHVAQENSAAAERLADAGYPYLVSGVLASRGVECAEDAAEFLTQETSLTYSPFLMRDMDKAVERIAQAVAAGERIAIFGDYDVDGITATCIMVDYLKSRGADVLHYIPRRIEDGYGLSRDAIEGLRKGGATLLVTVDCGITGVEEVAFARSIGMDVVVTDHHECKETLPVACAVVDPRRGDCEYPFKHLAGCGVALKLVLALGGPDREEALFSRYCTLAAVGTVADVMQMTGENRTIVSRGLATLDRSDFIGLHALLKEAGLAGREISSVQIGFVLAPRINAAGRMGAADMAADLLLCQDPAQAEELAKALCALNRERQCVEQTIYSQAEEMIEQLPEEERRALVLASDTWHQGVVGIVASRLSEKYSRPSFMIHLNGGVGKGSCRSWGGFTIDEANIPAFRERMNQYAAEYWVGKAPESVLEIDMELHQPGRVTLQEVEALSALEPYGSGNARPLFCLMGATLLRTQSVGQNRHLKLRLGKGNAQFDGIFFSTTSSACGCAEGDRVDAAFYLQVNEFRGNRTMQLQMVDIRPSLLASSREQESLALVRQCTGGGTVSARNARRMLPTREQYVTVWRALEHLVPEDGLHTAYLPLLRSLSAALGKTDAFLRGAFCLAVFQERGLLDVSAQGDSVTLHLAGKDKKVHLEDSVYIQRLADAETTGRGGGAIQ